MIELSRILTGVRFSFERNNVVVSDAILTDVVLMAILWCKKKKIS
jgi:hypothetical protein